MKNLRTTTRTLTDGSTVHQVRFDALRADGSIDRVTLEVYGRKSAARVFDALNDDAAWAETDPQE